MEQLNEFILNLTQNQIENQKTLLMLLWMPLLILLFSNFLQGNQKIFYASLFALTVSLSFSFYLPHVISEYYSSLNKQNGYSFNPNLLKLTKSENTLIGIKKEDIKLKCQELETIRDCLNNSL